MMRMISCGAMIVAIAAGSGGVAHAQLGGCTACAPTTTYVAPVTQTVVQPVVSTQYRQQQQISYRDVATTEYRQEASYESVPVTTYENVTVDEGGYQQVWVPKLVTKTVARQGYQTRLTQRTVPYQVTRRIPEVTTQLVPEQRVSYLSSSTTSYYPTYTTTYAAPLYTTYNTALLPPLTTPIVSVPTRTYTASRPRTAEPVKPVPDPEFDEYGRSNDDYEEATAIPKRRSSQDRYSGYRDAGRRTSKKFTPAPSAAIVQQTPRTYR